MKLRKLTATFGCLDHATLEFSDGMTLIGAPNGSGKSTWCAFLRTMLYGMDTRQRDRKGIPADKNRYRPWSGAPMEGLLVCEHEGRVVELRRPSQSGVPMGDFSAVDAATGLPLPELSADTVGEILTGVSREVFDRSVFLRQTGLAVSPSQELERRITALVSSGDEDVSWTDADSQLKAWQRRRRYHRSGLLPQLEEEERQLLDSQSETGALREALSEVQGRASSLRRQLDQWEGGREPVSREALQRRYEEAQADLEAAEERVRRLQSEADHPDYEEPEELSQEVQEIQDDLRSRRHMMAGFILVVLLLTLAIVGVYVLPRYDIPYVPVEWKEIPEFPLIFSAALVAVLWLLVLIFSTLKSISDYRDQKELSKVRALREEGTLRDAHQSHVLEAALIQRDQARTYFEAIREQGGPYLPPEAEACRSSLHKAEEELARLRGQLQAIGDPVLIDARLDEIREQSERLETDYVALDIAMDALRQADAQLQARFSPHLSKRAGDYFLQLTGGQYDQVSLTRSLEVTVRETGGLADLPLSMLSQGTVDQLYLALRLAVADLLLPRPDTAPLVLDDALMTFDDSRLELALDCLAGLARNRQVILFTCQHREFERLEGQASVTTVRLNGF